LGKRGATGKTQCWRGNRPGLGRADAVWPLLVDGCEGVKGGRTFDGEKHNARKKKKKKKNQTPRRVCATGSKRDNRGHNPHVKDKGDGNGGGYARVSSD